MSNVWNLTSGTSTEVGGGRYHKRFNADTDGVFATGELLISQRGAGANMSVDVAAGDVLITTIAGTACYHAWETATTNVVVTANSSGNPRWDAISCYVDVAAYAASDNSGAFKFKNTAGTPAASPSKPSGATIQADVGANNPYHVLGYVYVPNGATQIVNANNGTDGYCVDDRAFSQSIEQVRRDYDTQPERVITGLQPATSASLTSDISVGECYVRGRYVAKQRAESHLYTASKDTYVDIDSSHTFQYTEVALGAAEPAVASDSIRLAKVVSGAGTLSSVTDLRNFYTRGWVTASANLNLTSSAQTVTGTTITLSVSQTSVVFINFSVLFRPDLGTASCNTGDFLNANIDIDGTDYGIVALEADADDSYASISGSAVATLTAGAHTIKLEGLATASRGRIDGTHPQTGYTYEILPGIANLT